MPASPPPTATCPDCGAPLTALQARCWLCQRKAVDREAENPYGPPRPIAGKSSPFQFSLATLFALMTLVAVFLGLFMVAPGLGILLIVLVIPALRTMVAGVRRKQGGTPLTPLEKVGTFLVSLVIVGLVGIAGCIAFFFSCLAIVFADLAMGDKFASMHALELPIVTIVALAVVCWLLWLTRPRKPQAG